MMSADAVHQPVDVLHTVNLVTQCLCIPIVTIFVAMQLSVRLWFRQFSVLEDGSCLIAWGSCLAVCHGAIETF